MKKQYLEFEIKHQKIKRNDKFHVVGGSQRYLHARFVFCDDWEGEEAYAVFSGGGKSYRQKIADGECVVPWEVLCVKQFFVGCEAGDRITSDAAKVDVRPSGAPDADPSREPSQTLQRQVNALREDVDNLKNGNSGGAFPEFGKADAGKLLYISADGSVQPLALGAGLKIENGALVLNISTGGTGSESVTTEIGADGVLLVYGTDGAEIVPEVDADGIIHWPGVVTGVDDNGTLTFSKEDNL